MRSSVGPGVLLLAHPMMHDDTFKRAVVYLVEHRHVMSRRKGKIESLSAWRVHPHTIDTHIRAADIEINAPIHTHTYPTYSRKEGAYGLVVNQLSDMTLPQAVEGGCVYMQACSCSVSCAGARRRR